MTNTHVVFAEVMVELNRAEKKYPAWPDDPVLAAAVVGEEAGELLQAANNARWHGKGHADMRDEAIQTAAMAIRFLLHEYKVYDPI